MLREMLTQIDLGGDALLIFENKAKRGLMGRFFVSKGGGGLVEPVKSGAQICLAHVCDVHLGWSPGTWLVCQAGCGRRHLAADEVMVAKGDIAELVNNLHRMEPKLKVELLKRLEEFGGNSLMVGW